MTNFTTEYKVRKLLKELKDCMRWNAHVDETLYVMDLYYSINKHSTILNNEDKAFMQSVKVKLKGNV